MTKMRLVDTNKVRCECEHEAHFDDSTGKKLHYFEDVFPKEEIMSIHTPYGMFNVCKQCASECHGEN